MKFYFEKNSKKKKIVTMFLLIMFFRLFILIPLRVAIDLIKWLINVVIRDIREIVVVIRDILGYKIFIFIVIIMYLFTELFMWVSNRYLIIIIINIVVYSRQFLWGIICCVFFMNICCVYFIISTRNNPRVNEIKNRPQG